MTSEQLVSYSLEALAEEQNRLQIDRFDLPGATADNLDWAARKRAVAGRFQRSSLAMRLEAEQGKFDFNQRYRLTAAAFVASGGGIPLILQSGALIGTVGVSGLPDIDDHRLIVETLQQLLPGHET